MKVVYRENVRKQTIQYGNSCKAFVNETVNETVNKTVNETINKTVNVNVNVNKPPAATSILSKLFEIIYFVTIYDTVSIVFTSNTSNLEIYW